MEILILGIILWFLIIEIPNKIKNKRKEYKEIHLNLEQYKEYNKRMDERLNAGYELYSFSTYLDDIEWLNKHFNENTVVHRA